MQTESEQALHALKAAALYLQHPDVQAIPFAQPASVALRHVNAAISRLEFGEHLKHAADRETLARLEAEYFRMLNMAFYPLCQTCKHWHPADRPCADWQDEPQKPEPTEVGDFPFDPDDETQW